jgi:tetratricopeptide (TPR) repeat protein
VLELLVEAMDGDVEHVRSLWLAASVPTGSGGTTHETRMAGRRDELLALRRHVRAGSGLLLVTGEAGIGKTTLVEHGVAVRDAFVAFGACLPLSTEVPLLPIVEALRKAHLYEDGQWFSDALGACPPYVAGAMTLLMPELPGPGLDDDTRRGAGLHLASAIAAVLLALAERQPLVVLLEDLHWADSATLDVVEQLVTRPHGPCVVATWRIHDVDTPGDRNAWLTRVARSRGTATIELRPFTYDETAEQVRLLTRGEAPPARVAALHARSAGHPLFTAQLAGREIDADLPTLLVDLLDQRLGVLTGDDWELALALGLADRGLDHRTLREATGLPDRDLTSALRALHDRRLIVTAGNEARLSHPLLAEAVRRRAVPGEATACHRRLAASLARAVGGAAAEVAVHWKSAGDDSEELTWRIAAAREAARRHGPAQEAGHWVRALELWGQHDVPHGTPPITRTRAAFRAMHALWFAGRSEDVDALVASLLPVVDTLAPGDAAELLAVAGRTEATFRSLEEGLHLVERAVTLYRATGASTELVLTLRQRARSLNALGRLDEAAVVLADAAQVNAEIGDAHQARLIMAERARQDFAAGSRREGLAAVAEAVGVRPSDADPVVDATLAKYQTEMLLLAGAPTQRIVDAATQGLAIAETNGIENVNVSWLRFSLGLALARSGDLAGATGIVDRFAEDDPAVAAEPVHLLRAQVEMLQGCLATARERAERVLARRAFRLDMRSRWCGVLAEVHVWEGRPDRALAVLLPLLRDLVELPVVAFAAPYFLLAGRAAADASRRPGSRSVRRLEHVGELRDLVQRAVADPWVDQPGERAGWQAEGARAHGNATTEQWSAAAFAWDRRGRPHDAAYSRWRAARVALDHGHREVATKMLTRAAHDAVGHVPLSAAIRATAGREDLGPALEIRHG